ncbi:Uncharacterised protein [Shigella flexneri]|nr:Uncharacterised protein [Shigella flexneri]
MAAGARHFGYVDIVRPERFLQLFRQMTGHTDAVLLSDLVHRLVKAHHIFHPFAVLR